MAKEREYGDWQGKQCSDKRGFVCSMNKQNSYDSTGTPNKYSCPTEKGYIPHGTACYKIFSDALIGHDQAKTNCRADQEGTMVYAGLATVWDVHDNQLMHSMILEKDENKEKSYWLGLEVKNGDYNDWKWEDQHSYTYNNWADGNPKG